jgi:hypothetical protein
MKRSQGLAHIRIRRLLEIDHNQTNRRWISSSSPRPKQTTHSYLAYLDIMGSDQSKPVAGQKMRANEREIRQYRLKQRAHPHEGIGRVEQVYSDQDGSGMISDFFGRWTIVFATAFAIAAMICLVLPAFFGTPLTSEGFQADWDNAFSNVRDVPRSDPIDAGNGFTFRFGVTGYCIVPDAKIKGVPNQ